MSVLSWVGLAFAITGCTPVSFPERVELEAPEDVRLAAVGEAARYIGMEYEWGGQDVMPRGIDCSGLMVNVYDYAATLYGYELPFDDATASGMMESFCVDLDAPEVGDLLFMGAAESDSVTHVAILEYQMAGDLHFIDATVIPDLGIDGVSRRSYPAGDSRFKAFGRLILHEWRARRRSP